MSEAQIRGSVILHELAHALGAIADDGGNSALSRSNSMLIKHFCFPNTPSREVNTNTSVSTDIILPGGGGGGGDTPAGGGFPGVYGGGWNYSEWFFHWASRYYYTTVEVGDEEVEIEDDGTGYM